MFFSFFIWGGVYAAGGAVLRLQVSCAIALFTICYRNILRRLLFVTFSALSVVILCFSALWVASFSLFPVYCFVVWGGAGSFGRKSAVFGTKEKIFLRFEPCFYGVKRQI